MASRQPSAELRAFGAEVTRLREAAGITRTELAKRVTVSRSYVGQVEAGTTRCRRDFAERLDGALGTGTAIVDAWDDLLRSTGYPKWFADFPRAEAMAVLLRAYQAFLVDGLLQTEDYARALLLSDEAVARRLKRQAILTREHPPQLFVVLDESVLLRRIGSNEIMRAQADHLIKASEQGIVTLQVAPIGYPGDVGGSFVIATQPDGNEVVYLANVTRGETTSEPSDILSVTQAFAAIQAHALPVEESRALIGKIRDERWTT
jgi:transcriptional regulator with XRE-family HTH domain